MKTTFLLYSARETEEFGRMLAKYLFPGSLILLSGNLGTGKTTLTKGVAKGLGITQPVTSPTFTIIQEYETDQIKLFHIDTYRLEEPEELLEIGLEEYINSFGITVIEWPEIVNEYLPDEYLKISLQREYTETGEEYRSLTMESKGDKYAAIIKEMVDNADIGCR